MASQDDFSACSRLGIAPGDALVYIYASVQCVRSYLGMGPGDALCTCLSVFIFSSDQSCLHMGMAPGDDLSAVLPYVWGWLSGMRFFYLRNRAMRPLLSGDGSRVCFI